MSVSRFTVRRLMVMAAAVALVAPLGVAQAQPDQSKVPGKTFAAYRYHWGKPRFVATFDGPLDGRVWRRAGPGIAQDQHGQFTLFSTRHGTVNVTLAGHAHRVGRWEIRFRGKNREYGHAKYTLNAMLVPATASEYHCGAQNITFTGYKPNGGRRAGFSIHTLPNLSFNRSIRVRHLVDDYWHTWGVELTRHRISWFVDGHVRATERRPAAVHHSPLTIRLQLTAVPGATMNFSRLQVDTVRYFDLRRKNTRSVRAPAPRPSTYAAAC